MSEALKPCPCCGCSTCVRIPSRRLIAIQCHNCGTASAFYKTEDEAIEAWNRRPSPWHTGKPTESVNKDGSAIPYLVTDKTGSCYDVSRWHSENGGYWGVSWFEVFAWQKIKLYKEQLCTAR